MQNPSAEAFSTDTQRWEALARRDRQADGAFIYAVKTTGIYCRPTCSSRLPNPANVQFFQTGAEAEQAGFRPCKRCQPDRTSPHNQQVEIMAAICKQIEESAEPLSLKELANAAGLSPFHFHRLFKEIVGVTPKDYATAHRAKRIRQELDQGAPVTDAIYKAGFGTSSSFYEGATTLLGMSPTQYKTGAAGIEICVAVKPCFLGWVLVAATDRGICAIEFGDSPELLSDQLRRRFARAQFHQEDPRFDRWVEQVIAYIETPQRGFNLPLDIQGTAFQKRVWETLQAIPLGSTASYGEIARRIGNPKAVRAVARACASNPVAVAIPCHRVVGSDGALTGYRWGIERKRSLLAKEAAIHANL